MISVKITIFVIKTACCCGWGGGGGGVGYKIEKKISKRITPTIFVIKTAFQIAEGEVHGSIQCCKDGTTGCFLDVNQSHTLDKMTEDKVSLCFLIIN